MFKFLRLVRYIYSKRKYLFNTAVNVLAIVFFFMVINFTIFFIVSMNPDKIDVFKFFAKGFFHVLIASFFFVRFAYKYLVNNLFRELFEENQEELFESVETFMLDNNQVSKLTVTTEDNYLLRMNGFIEKLPIFIRVVITKGLSFVPFYAIYQDSLQQNIEQEERVKWLVEHVKEDTLARFDNKVNVIVLIGIPTLNWLIMVSYWLR